MRWTSARRHLRRGRCATALLLTVAALAAAAPAGAQTHDPNAGPGGPILVVADPADPFGRYHAEILRAEGLNAFAVTTTAALTPEALAAHQVVLLAGGAALGAGHVDALTAWVHAGGNLVAMRPRAELAGLLGIGADAGDLAEGYVGIDTSAPPGAGLTATTMQFHGVADRWTGGDARAVAALFSDAATPAGAPAVTLRSVGTAGGQAAAFAYDLARSVVYTRQGNPQWAGDDREQNPIAPSIRSADLFYGAKPGDTRPDWVDFSRIAIPQADEQQRLLANLITAMNLDRAPLPRFWYLPRGERAAVVMTGDDHANGGTDDQFDRFLALSRPGCSVARWECVRATSYLYAGSPMTNSEAAAYAAQGFEVAMHFAYGGCDDFPSLAALEAEWELDLATWTPEYPSVSPPRTNRGHCVTWSDWASMAKAEAQNGVRLDTNYYYASDWFVQDRPGLFTGSGFPMRFADADGTLIDVYQATTQLTDEGITDYAKHIAALLDGALGPQGHYGVFTANMHTDHASHSGAEAIVAAAQARGVPVISAAQLLTWLDGRNGSAFQDVRFAGGELRFRIAPAPGAEGLESMVPAHSAHGPLLALTANGVPVATQPRTLKGVEYAVFPAAAAEYVATYPAPPAAAAPAPPAARAAAVRQRLRASRRGVVRIAVRCRRAQRACRIKVKLRHAGKVVDRATKRVRDGRKAKVALQLPRGVRRKLARKGSLPMTVLIRGHRPGRAVATRPVRVLAPRR